MLQAILVWVSCMSIVAAAFFLGRLIERHEQAKDAWRWNK